MKIQPVRRCCDLDSFKNGLLTFALANDILECPIQPQTSRPLGHDYRLLCIGCRFIKIRLSATDNKTRITTPMWITNDFFPVILVRVICNKVIGICGISCVILVQLQVIPTGRAIVHVSVIHKFAGTFQTKSTVRVYAVTRIYGWVACQIHIVESTNVEYVHLSTIELLIPAINDAVARISLQIRVHWTIHHTFQT